jgi:hypothetical protein
LESERIFQKESLTLSSLNLDQDHVETEKEGLKETLFHEHAYASNRGMDCALMRGISHAPEA